MWFRLSIHFPFYLFILYDELTQNFAIHKIKYKKQKCLISNKMISISVLCDESYRLKRDAYKLNANKKKITMKQNKSSFECVSDRDHQVNLFITNCCLVSFLSQFLLIIIFHYFMFLLTSFNLFFKLIIRKQKSDAKISSPIIII